MTTSLRLFAIAALTATACSAPSLAAAPPAEAPAIAVRLAAVERVRRAEPIAATAVLARKAELRASFKVGGVITTIAVDEGDVVKRGQVLARIAGTEIGAAVEQARQGVAKAERDLARAQRLLDGKAATGEQVDDATTGAEVARAQLRAARFNAAHAVIRAPADGRVLRRLAEAGELAAPGQPILILASDDQGWVARVALADRDVVRLAPGDAATIALPAFPGAPLAAVVDEIASAATPPTGTYEVELRLTGPTPALMSGLVGHAAITPTPRAEVTLVPAAALRDGHGKQARVWRVGDAGIAEPRDVTIAYFDGDRVALSAGLDGVAAVVTDGAAYLATGTRVNVVQP